MLTRTLSIERPNSGPKSICLNMIVKNESQVIARCLASVKHLIDYWVICDTGSTDGTQALIRQALTSVPGELHEHEWVNFGHNRTEALQLALGHCDYVLLLDADMVLVQQGEFKHKLTADSYLLRQQGPLEYQEQKLLRSGLAWRYVGVTHEYVFAPDAGPRVPLPELQLRHFADGGARADKFTRDIMLLEQGLLHEPGNARYLFYLAQSYRDLGDLPRALQYYQLRVEAGGWDEEIWYALYQIASLRERQGADWPLVLDACLQAYHFRPSRIEPLYLVAKHYRQQCNYSTGHLFTQAAMAVAYPQDLLFIDRPVYDYLLPMEHAICCHYVGRYKEAIVTNNRILSHDDLPELIRNQVLANNEYSKAAEKAVTRSPEQLIYS